MYLTSWIGIGSSRPQRSRAASRSSAVTFGLRRRTRSGEPGIIRNRTKFRTTMKKTVPIAWTTLFSR